MRHQDQQDWLGRGLGTASFNGQEVPERCLVVGLTSHSTYKTGISWPRFERLLLSGRHCLSIRVEHR